MQEFMKPENLPTALHYLQKAREQRVAYPVDIETLRVEVTKFAELIDAIEAAQKVCTRRDNAAEATHSNDAGALYKLDGDSWYSLDEEDGEWDYIGERQEITPANLTELQPAPPNFVHATDSPDAIPAEHDDRRFEILPPLVDDFAYLTKDHIGYPTGTRVKILQAAPGSRAVATETHVPIRVPVDDLSMDAPRTIGIRPELAAPYGGKIPPSTPPVTVSEFGRRGVLFDANVVLPATDCEVIIRAPGFTAALAHFKKENNSFTLAGGGVANVSHWAYMPEPVNPASHRIDPSAAPLVGFAFELDPVDGSEGAPD